MSLQTNRIVRMKKLLGIVKGLKQVDVNELFGMVSLSLGISRRTFDEYLQALENHGIVVDGNTIKAQE